MRWPTLYHVLVIPGAVLATALALGFLRYTSAIESEELRFRLNNLAVRSDFTDSSDLLIRLEAEQRANRAPEQKSAEEELQLMAAFGERTQIGKPHAANLSPVALFYRRLIEGLQLIAGVRPAQHVYLESGPDVLTLAYNLERRRLFSEALLTFQKGLAGALAPATRDFVLLHSGYCLFFLADYDAAEKSWQRVAENPAHAANRILADRLIDWLKRFRKGWNSARQNKRGKAQALEYFRILAYKESLDALLTVSTAERDAEYYLLRGRAREAPGDFQNAADDYAEVLQRAKNPALQVAANRRLYAMATLYRPNPRLAAAAEKKAAALNDGAFVKTASAYVPNLPADSGGADYAPEKAYRELISKTGEKILRKSAGGTKAVRMIRIRTHNGSVITGREIASGGGVVIILNENGRFRIPSADIESKEIVSGN